jgi:hypothetical protein
MQGPSVVDRTTTTKTSRRKARRRRRRRRPGCPTDDSSGKFIPSFLTEYTIEDIARFNEYMAHNDRLLDEAAAKLAVGRRRP